MDAEVSTLSTTPLSSILPTDSNTAELKEPTLNGLLHKEQNSEPTELCVTKTCDGSSEKTGILTFREESASNAANKNDEGEKMAHTEGNSSPTKNELPQASKELNEAEEEDMEDPKNDNDDLAEDEDEEGENDEADGDDSFPKKNQRPKRDVPRRSVFEMLQSEINEDDDEYDDVAEDDNDEDVVIDNGKSKGRRKGRAKENDPELNLDGLNDDDDDDEDFSAEGPHKKSSAKKRTPLAKKEEKTLVLFDDEDLPLKGKRSGGRPKKKKTDDEEAPSEDDWRLIKGKLFHDEDDDHENDIDDYAYRQQLLGEKKVLTSSNKRSFDGGTKSSKKIKIDVQGWKFSKPRDGMESKQKSKLSSGSTILLQASGHHGSNSGSITSASRHPADDGRTGCTSGLRDDDLRRKQSILTIWEQKLRHLDRELEERAANIQRNEGKILREERRLKELETLLAYREKLLGDCEGIASCGKEDALERKEGMKRDYEKYRRLAEGHRDWIEREHRRIEAHALGNPFEEDGDVDPQIKKVTDNLPLLEQNSQDEVTVIPILLEKDEEAIEESKTGKTLKYLKEVKVDG